MCFTSLCAPLHHTQHLQNALLRIKMKSHIPGYIPEVPY